MRRTILLSSSSGLAGALLAACAIVAACTGDDPDLVPAGGTDAATETTTGELDGTTDTTTAPDVDAGPVPDATPDPSCVQPDAASAVLAHTEYGFRDAQGGCGWSYRSAAPATITFSSEMPLHLPLDGGDGGHGWFVESGNVAQLTRTGGHPSSTAVVIRRWVSPYAGDIRVRGVVNVPGSGDADDRDGVTSAIVRNGNAVEAVDVRGASVNIDRQLKVAVGDEIDLILTMRSTPTFDSTEYALEIVRD